jgi:hypothetical protein
MRLIGLVGVLALLLVTAAEAALPPAAVDREAFGDCASPSLLDNESCGVAMADEAVIAAELLFLAMGSAAITYATERAERLFDDNDFDAAALWRRIAAAAAELAARRPLPASPR